MIDERQRRLIRETFDRLRPEQVRAGELFYELLFAQTPAVRHMFGGTSMPSQGGKLMQVLAYAVDGVDLWANLTDRVEDLGERHAALGIRSDHYAAVGTALLNTLRTVLGENFTEEAEQAWADFYADLSLVMERGSLRARVKTHETEQRKDEK